MLPNEINLAIIGAGRWGMNHVKTAAKILPPDQITVCDKNRSVKEKLSSISSKIKFTTNLADVLFNKEINTVIVATPAETHYITTFALLKEGKNVLVEKPITLQSAEAKILIKQANENSCKLMVGHVLLFHPAIIKMKQLIDEGKVGKLQYIYSNRLNLGAIRREENILWSFAPHDISILQYLTGTYPENITANGATFLQNQIEDTTLTFLEYPNNIKAHIFVSWINPIKEQRLVVIGEKGMFVFEDSLKENKLKYYTKGFEKINGSMEKFDNGVINIDYPDKMPLSEEHIHFYDCIVNNKIPLTDGKHALDVLEILEEATRQLKSGTKKSELVIEETEQQRLENILSSEKISARA